MIITDFEPVGPKVLLRLKHDTPPFRIFEVVKGDGLTAGVLVTVNPGYPYLQLPVDEENLQLVPLSEVLGIVQVAE